MGKKKEKKKKGSLIEQKHKKFAQEFFITNNGPLSYAKVYNKEPDNPTLNASASRLLKNPKVLEMLQKLQDEHGIVTKQDIIQSNIDIRDRALARNRFSDAVKANAEISKLSGFYQPDKVEHTGVIEFTLGDAIVEDDDE